jgi:hypothetical protein
MLSEEYPIFIRKYMIPVTRGSIANKYKKNIVIDNFREGIFAGINLIDLFIQ